jgi:hypothetical protein
MYTEIAVKPEMQSLSAAARPSSLGNRRLRRLIGFAALAVVAGFSLLSQSGLDVEDGSLDAADPGGAADGI